MDNTTLIIEHMALKTNSYIEAIVDFAEKYPGTDFEEIVGSLNPVLISKIRQEFIDKNYIPHLKQKSIMDFLKD